MIPKFRAWLKKDKEIIDVDEIHWFHEEIDFIGDGITYQGRYGMESIDALRNFMTPEQLKGFYLGNALKYLLRHQKKNGLEDLKKARKNLDWLIEEMEHEN